MKNLFKEIAEKSVEQAFTTIGHYQPKMPKSLMAKVEDENKKEN
jgi:cyclic lactone autoinducer peptide